MLVIRLKPMGKKHKRLYRIVLAQKHHHVTKKYVESLGWYNPYSGKVSFDNEKIKHYLSLNVELSETVRHLLIKNSIISKN